MADPRVAITITANAAAAANAIKQVAAQFVGLGAESRAAADKARASAGRIREGVESISTQLDKATAGIRKFAAAYVGIGAARSVLSTAAEFEQLNASLKTVFGTAEKAAEQLAFVRALSDRLGVGLQDTAKAWLGFAAAARGSALEGAQAQAIFTSLVEASKAVGLSTDDTRGALLALQQMMSKGTVSAEELRGQLGERLYGAFQAAAQSIGVTQQQFSKLLDQGLIPAEKFLPAFAAQLRQEFGAGVADASATASSALARFDNALTDLKLTLANGGFFDAAVDALRNMTDSFKDPQFLSAVREFGSLLGKTVKFVAEHAGDLATLGGVIAGARTGAFIGRIGGAAGALIGAGVGAVAGGVMASSVTPDSQAGRNAQPLPLQQRIELLQRQIKGMEQGMALQSGRSLASAQAALAAQKAALAALLAQAASKVDPLAGAAAAGKALGADLLKKLKGGKTAQDTSGARLALVRAQAESEFALLNDGLKRAQTAFDRALDQHLVSIRGYYAAKTAIDQQAIDAEIARDRQQLAAQQAQATGGKTENDRLRASAEVAKIEADLIALNNKRADVEVANAAKAAAAERSLADALARARQELAQLTGTATDADRRAAVAAQYADLKAQMAAEGQDTALIDRLIDVKAASANLDALQARWSAALEAMRAQEESVRIQQQAGLLTAADAQDAIARAHQNAAASLSALLPELERTAQVVGSPDSLARIQSWKNEIASIQTVVDPMAASFNAAFKDGLTGLFEDVISRAKSARDAFADFGRSVLATIEKILAQRLAEKLLGGLTGGSGEGAGGTGGWVSAGLKLFGFATGGLVRGPGTATSDSIPARLSAGEYVVRADAVRRLGVGFLDTLNGLRAQPGVVAGRMAFAAGGLVPAAAPAQPAAAQAQPVRLQLSVHPDALRMTLADWLEGELARTVATR